jgi:cell volume regulation protein A
MRPHNAGRPRAGDQVYIITTPRYLPLLDRLFARPAPIGADDPRLYGEFALDPEAKLGDIAQAYDVTVAKGDQGITIADLFRRELAGDIEAGDRIALGPVDLIVRRVNEDHAIEEAGVALAPTRAAPVNIPIFQSPREIAASFRGLRERFGKREAAPAETPSAATPASAAPPDGAPEGGDSANADKEPEQAKD